MAFVAEWHLDLAMKNELLSSSVLPRAHQRRELRTRAGLTLVDVGEAIGVTASAVSRWERGLRIPNRSNRQAYVEVLSELKDAVGRWS